MIACLIATWRDGELLADAVASAAAHVDDVIVLDGAYVGVVPADCDARSRVDELAAAARAGGLVFGPHPDFGGWPGEIEKRNALLELARAFGHRWALVLDADEELDVPPDVDFRKYVELVDAGVYAPGLYRVEPDGAVWWAPSRLFGFGPRDRYAGRSYWLEGPGRPRRSLEHRGPLDPGNALEDLPHVEHRWDRREPWRAAVQRTWGRRLAELDAAVA